MTDLSNIDLRSVEAKLRRADAHAKAFAGEVAAFTQLYAHSITVECNADATQYIARIRFGSPVDFVAWGLVLGDYVHCLRSALDHLIYAIAVAESNSDPPPDADKVMMPLRFAEQGFRDVSSRRLSYLSDVVRARIETLQPYPDRPHNLLLGLLERLDIGDKHRVLPVVVVRPIHAETLIDGPAKGTMMDIDASVAALEDGASFLTLTFDRPTPNVKVYGKTAMLVVIPDPADPPQGLYDAGNLVLLLRLEVRRAVNVILERPSEPVNSPAVLTGYKLETSGGRVVPQ